MKQITMRFEIEESSESAFWGAVGKVVEIEGVYIQAELQKLEARNDELKTS